MYNDGNSIDGGLNIYNITGSGETISFTVSFGTPLLSVSPDNINLELESGSSYNQVIGVTNSGDASPEFVTPITWL